MSHHARAEVWGDGAQLHFDANTRPARPRRTRLVVRAGVVVLGIFAFVGLLLGLGSVRDREGWVRVGSTEVFPPGSVTHLEDLGVFIVPSGWHNTFLALADRAPERGESIRYCRSSRWFEDFMHGSKWDHYGHYRLGPAPRGMDRYRVRVTEDGHIEVFVDESLPGPARGMVLPGGPHQPDGAFCVPGSESI